MELAMELAGCGDGGNMVESSGWGFSNGSYVWMVDQRDGSSGA